MTPAEFDAFIKEEIVVQGELAKAAGFKAKLRRGLTDRETKGE